MGAKLAGIVLALLAILAATSSSQRVDAAAGPGLCETYSGDYTNKYLEEAGRSIASRLPARYSPLIRGIRIAPGSDPNLLGPAVREGAELSIEVPATFLEDQCWMVAVHSYLERKPGAVDQLRAELAGCAAAGTPIMPCFRRAAPALIGDFGTAPSKEGGSPEPAAPEWAVRDAADYLIAHEMSHIVTRRTKTRKQILDMDEEYEADLFAQLAIASQRPVHVGVIMSLTTTSILSEYRPVPPTHDPDLCRLARVSRILGLTTRQTIDVTLARGGTLIFLSDNEDIVKRILDLAGPFLARRSPPRECRLDPPPAIERFVDDLNYLQSRYRQLEGKGAEALIPALSEILRHEFGSEFGEMIGISTVTGMFLGLDGSKFISGNLAWPKATGRESAAYSKLMAEIWSLADAGTEGSNVRAAELSGLILLRALYNVANRIGDRSAAESFQSFMTRYERAESLFDALSSSRSTEIGVWGMIGENTKFGADLIAAASSTYIAALFATGRCERAARYAALQGKLWNWDIGVMARGAEPEICKKFGDAAWAFARESGWPN